MKRLKQFVLKLWRHENYLLWRLFVLAVILPIWLLFALVFVYFPNFINGLRSFFGQFWLNVIGITFIGAMGVGLYYFRQRWRGAYGLVEVAFALAYGWYAINKVESAGYVEILSIMAAVYLVVRGVDNYQQGRKDRVGSKEKKE